MSAISLPIKLLHDDAQIPTKKNFEDAGWDLYCLEDVEVGSEVVKVRTGVAVSIPKGYVGLIWDRSGLGSKGLKVHGGVIDSGYTGEIFVCLSLPAQPERINVYTKHMLSKGDRIAQLLIQLVPLHVTWEEVDNLDVTDRGNLGFGSSGQ